MMHTLIKKHIVFLSIALLACIICVGGMWRFATIMHAKKAKVITAKQALASYEENKKIFADESLALASIGDRATRLEQYRVTSDTTPELLSKLEDLAKQYKVDFAITTVQAVDDSKKLLIDFSSKGSTGSVDAFLAALSRQTYEVRFTKFSLFADNSTPPPVVPTQPGITPAAPVVIPGSTWEVLASIEIVSF